MSDDDEGSGRAEQEPELEGEDVKKSSDSDNE
jgi:hypothetical protein